MNCLEPEKVKENMTGQDYHGIKVRIKCIYKISEIDEYAFDELKEYDDAGNLPFKYEKFEEQLNDETSDFFEHFGVNKDSYIVGVEEIESGEKNVYSYGYHGVFVSAWKGSKKLTDLNDKTGLLEHLESFKTFEARRLVQENENKIQKIAKEFETYGFDFKKKSKFDTNHYSIEVNGFDMHVHFKINSNSEYFVFISNSKVLDLDDPKVLKFVENDVVYDSVEDVVKAFKNNLPLYSSKKMSDLGKTGIWSK